MELLERESDWTFFFSSTCKPGELIPVREKVNKSHSEGAGGPGNSWTGEGRFWQNTHIPTGVHTCLHAKEMSIWNDKENNLCMHLALPLLQRCPSLPFPSKNSTWDQVINSGNKFCCWLCRSPQQPDDLPCPSASCSRYLQKELKVLAEGCCSGRDQSFLCKCFGEGEMARWDGHAPGDTGLRGKWSRKCSHLFISKQTTRQVILTH